MRIGIISMQMVDNYGSYLQAFALKSILESLGHRCYFIEPRKDIDIPVLRRTSLFYIQKIRERFFSLDFIQRVYYHYSFKKHFSIFKRELFPIGALDDTYDLVVIGSDEVFNCIQSAPWCFSSHLFGHNIHANKIASYAGSFGHTTIHDIQQYKVLDIIKDGFFNMDNISVRDVNSFKIIKSITGISPEIHIDPVLLYNYDSLVVDNIPDKDYLLIYSYPNRIRDTKEIYAIKSFAKQYNLKMISIGFYFSWCDKTVILHPFKVLSYFKNARYVVTDTFHGTVMSIKYNKQFATLVRETNKQKLTSLLSQFHLKDRIIEDAKLLPTILSTDIDYDKANDVLVVEKNKSNMYLQSLIDCSKNTPIR